MNKKNPEFTEWENQQISNKNKIKLYDYIQ